MDQHDQPVPATALLARFSHDDAVQLVAVLDDFAHVAYQLERIFFGRVGNDPWDPRLFDRIDNMRKTAALHAIRTA